MSSNRDSMSATHISARDMAGWVAHRVWQRFRAAAAFSLACKLLHAMLIAPILTFGLKLLLQRWGRASVGNFEIAEFLLSPPGVAAVLSIGTITATCLFFELAGLMRLLADSQLHWWQALWGSREFAGRLVGLGARQLVFYLVLAVPVLAGIGLTYALLWHGRDLNGLIILKPPVFWMGISLAGLLTSAYLLLSSPSHPPLALPHISLAHRIKRLFT